MLKANCSYRAYPIDWVLRESEKADSRSVMFTMRLDVCQYWNGSDWQDTEERFECFGEICLVNRAGELNESGINQMRDALNWNGDWTVLSPGASDFQRTLLQLRTREDTYEGRTRVRPSWFSAAAARPGGELQGAAPPERISSLAMQYGSQTRALLGAAPRPPGSPPVPPF